MCDTTMYLIILRTNGRTRFYTFKVSISLSRDLGINTESKNFILLYLYLNPLQH